MIRRLNFLLVVGVLTLWYVLQPSLATASRVDLSRVELPPATGTDTAVINVALASSRYVQCAEGENYTINSSLLIKSSGTTLDMTGCTLTLASGSGSNMVRNGSGGRLADITIKGGTWNRGDNMGDGNNRHSIFLRGVDRITVEDLRVTSTSGKYAIAIGDATEVRVRNISFKTASDGVHITGPADNVDIQSIMGTTGDDQVALTPRDYSWYDDVRGAITNVTISDIFCENSLSAVKIGSADATGVEGVSATHLRGSTKRPPVAIMLDPAGSTGPVGPFMANGIVISDVDAQVSDPTIAPLWIRGVDSTDISISDWRMRKPLTNNPMILVDGTNNTIDSLNIEGWTVAPSATTQATVVTVAGSTRVGALRLSRVRVPAAWHGQFVTKASTATIDSNAVSDLFTVPAAKAK
jgi:hypothetical protein